MGDQTYSNCIQNRIFKTPSETNAEDYLRGEYKRKVRVHVGIKQWTNNLEDPRKSENYTFLTDEVETVEGKQDEEGFVFT